MNDRRRGSEKRGDRYWFGFRVLAGDVQKAIWF